MSQSHSDHGASDAPQTEHGGGHGGGHGHGENVYPYTPHHFHAAKQHFESGKLGVWLFLVTEILFFAGLFCAYTVYRAQHPEVFYWAHFYLDTTLGAANTVVLILSSFTAAWAVRNAQLGQQGLLKLNIILTICGALFFMGVKSVEYNHKFHDGLLPAGHFEPKHEVWETDTFKKKHPEAAAAAEEIIAGLEARKNATALVDTVRGDDSPKLRLVPVQNEPAAATTTAAPTAVKAEPTAVKATSAPEQKEAASAQPSTPNPRSTPEGQSEVARTAHGSPGSAEAAPPVEQAEPVALPADKKPIPEDSPTTPPVPTPAEEVAGVADSDLSDDVWLERKIRELNPDARRPLEMAGVIRKASEGGLTFARPEKAGIFFSIYFFMTGLHGVHVLIGIGIWVWMLTIAARRKFGPQYFGPIDFSALYWHLVDLIWIYLFPMLYLIH